jgi:hypothetical protein
VGGGQQRPDFKGRRAMHQAKAVITKLVIIAVLSLGLSGLTATPAAAYGNNAVYQITFSFNCNTVNDPCYQQFGFGGLWGWIALNSDGTADIQATACGHDRAGTGGATHFGGDGSWSSTTIPGMLFIPASVLPFPLAFPATPGQYFFDSNMNVVSHPVSGAATMINVVKIPNR